MRFPADFSIFFFTKSILMPTRAFCRDEVILTLEDSFPELTDFPTIRLLIFLFRSFALKFHLEHRNIS